MSRPHLIVTWSLDRIGELRESISAKLLVSSLIRSFVNCQVLVFRHGDSPLFLVDRLGVIELPAVPPGEEADAPLANYRGPDSPEPWEFFVSDHLDLAPFDKVLFLPPHCLALRNIDHLLDGDWDVAWQPLPKISPNDPEITKVLGSKYAGEFAGPRPLASPNFIAVRAAVLEEVLAEWQEVHETVREEYETTPALVLEEGQEEVVIWKPAHAFFESWNLFLRRTRFTNIRVEKGEIRFPLWLDPRFQDYCDSALLLPDGADGADLGPRERLFYSLYMGTFFKDPNGHFLQFVEM